MKKFLLIALVQCRRAKTLLMQCFPPFSHPADSTLRKLKNLGFLACAAVSLYAALPAVAATLSGGISATDILNSFYGRWHVTSKVLECDDPTMFNNLSVDIWELSGHKNILVLTNPNSGATSSISIENNNINGKTLKFTRTKVEQAGSEKAVYIEMPELTMEGDIFRGFDTYIVERYKNGALVKRNVVKYKLVGQKI